jgi:uncharacterized protein
VAIAVLFLLAPILVKVIGFIPSGSFTGPRDFLFHRFGFPEDARVEILTTASVADILRMNLSNWFGQVDYVITSGMIFKIFGCFLLGFTIGRNEIYKKLDIYRPLLKRLAFSGILIGLPLNVAYAITFISESLLHTIIAAVAILPLSAGYTCVVALLWIDTKKRKLLKHFAPVGRMALTNYVGQSVICALIFYSAGFAIGGKIGPTLYLPLGIAIYFVQVLASRAWLNRFQFGPLEWLWRVLTYGTWVPLTKRMIVSPN